MSEPEGITMGEGEMDVAIIEHLQSLGPNGVVKMIGPGGPFAIMTWDSFQGLLEASGRNLKTPIKQ